MIGFVFIYFILMFVPISLNATVIGSNTNVARQARAFFRKATSPSNEMRGFSVFKKGMVLENPSTSALFDAFFPVSGDVVLNGGTLNLQGDLEFKNPFRIGVGTVIGNGFSLQFPRNISYLDFPSLYYIKLIVNLVEQTNVGNDIYSIDWSYDDAYLAVGLRGAGGKSELKIFSFDGSTLTEIVSQDFGTNHLNAVRWSPSSDYIITGASGGTELKSWLFNRALNTLQGIDSVDFGTVGAVAWNPAGDHVVVGGKSNSSLHVYPVSNGLFGSPYSSSFGGSVTVRNNAIDWNSSGDHVAVGLQTGGQSELQFFEFTGSQLLAAGDVELGVNVESVSWRGTTPQLTVGLGGGSERLRLYTYDADTDSAAELSTGRVALDKIAYSVSWDSVGRYLAVTKEYAAQGYELEMYYFDDTDNTLHLVSGYSPDYTSRAVAWAHNDEFVVNGDDNGDCFLYDFTGKPFVFSNLKIYFGSEVRTHASIHFQGDCVMNGSGNILQLSSTTSLVIEPGATLHLEDMTIKGIAGDNIYCMGDDSQLDLRDVTWVQDANVTFTTGSLQFQNDIEFSGDYNFLYQSDQQSTVKAKSQFLLSPLFTFSYDPADGVSDSLLAFEDSTSLLALDGATLATGPSGLQLSNGKLRVLRDSFLSSDEIGGITLGNRVAAQDFACDILSGSVLHLTQGALNYKNVNAASWNMISERSWLKMQDGTRLRLYEALSLGLGTLWIEGDAILSRLPGKDVSGIMVPKGRLFKEFMVAG